MIYDQNKYNFLTRKIQNLICKFFNIYFNLLWHKKYYFLFNFGACVCILINVICNYHLMYVDFNMGIYKLKQIVVLPSLLGFG